MATMSFTRLLLRLSAPLLVLCAVAISVIQLLMLPAAPQLAFVAIDQQSYTLNLADARHRLEVPIARYSARISTPVWSPDGRYVAFREYVLNRHQLTIYDVQDRREIISLRDGTTQLSLPAWSPDGQSLAFVSDEMMGEFHLYIANLEEGGVRQLTREPINDFTPVWSGDGESLVYAAWREDRIVGAQIDVESSAEAIDESILLPEFSSMYGATWSPDRMQIAFSSTGSNAVRSSSIYVLAVDGNTGMALDDSRTVTNSAESNIVPIWSPEGDRIAFVSDRDGDNDLYMVGTTQDMPQRLTHLNTDLVHAGWSPDGSRIAFIARQTRGWSVMILDVASNAVYALTRDRVPIAISWRP
ncbi:MAG: DPP IV N-terminal domain-containing protein [Aggregatilineales bacterium]